jgi:hypothetical protein
VGIGVAILALLLAKNAIQANQLFDLHAAATAPGAPAAALKARHDASTSIIPPADLRAQELAGFGGGFFAR